MSFFLLYTNGIPEGKYLSWCHSCVSSILQPIPLSNAGDQPVFSLSYSFFISAEPTLVAGLGVPGGLLLMSHRDYHLYHFFLLLYIELLVYGHSVQTLP